MLLRLVSPVQRKGSRNLQFVKRIPADLRAAAVGTRLAVPLGGEDTIVILVTPEMTALRFSLRTADPAQAKVREATALAYIEQVFAAWRTDAPVSLSRKQATALSGVLYRSWADEARERSTSITFGSGGEPVDDEGDLPEEAEAIWEATKGYLLEVDDAGDSPELEAMLGGVLDRLLLAYGIRRVDAPTRRLLLQALLLAMRDAAEARLQKSRGDYRPDRKAERFPAWEPPKLGADSPAPSTPPAKVSLTGLLEDWWREAKAGGLKQATYDNYGAAVRHLKAFLKHDDAARVTPEDVIAFKDHRLSTPSERTGKPVSARTIKDNDLAALRSVFGWAVANRKLPSNPAEGITVKVRKAAKLRSNGFRPEEVKALLSACLRLARGQQSAESYALKRWVPWILAYTGARVGEIVQLRKQDVIEQDGHWTIRITPEAGTVKGNEAREVPVHPHLVETGFIKFVEAAPGGYLFISSQKARGGSAAITAGLAGKIKGAKNHLREFVRQYVPDPNVQPNHAWRHLFLTVCRQVGIEEGQQYRLVGHTARSVHERYGEAAGLYREICKLPRFEIT